MMDQYTIIGKFIATFGIKGDLVLKHHMGEGLNVDALKTLFIEEKSGKFMPYFIASVNNKNDEEALIQLEGVDAPEKAKIFLRKQVWLPEQEVKIQASKHAPISLLGYTVVDGKVELGKVLEVIEQPMQILLRIDYKEKEVFIPLNESTLLKIDHKKEKITVSLPDGLLDIYIN